MIRYCLTLLFTLVLFCAAAQDYTFYDAAGKICSPDQARSLSLLKHTDSGYAYTEFWVKDRRLKTIGLYKDSLCTIKNGMFRTFHPNKALASIGKYSNNKKTGLWMEFYSNQYLSDSTVYNENGQPTGISLGFYRNGYPSDSTVFHADGTKTGVYWFDNGNISGAGRFDTAGKKHGKWIYYHRNGNFSATILFRNGNLTESKYFDETGQEQATAVPDRECAMRGGVNSWMKFLEKKIQWPSNYAITNADSVVIVVEFWIDEEGKMKDIEVVVPFADPFDNAALRALSDSPVWIPAIRQNRKVRSSFRQPIVFRKE